MSHALVIATREVREKGQIFTLALILAVLPFLATLVPAMRGWGKPMIIGFFGGTLGVALGLGLAIAFGVSAIGRELSDRRLSFYFARPVSPAAIWSGKAMANIFTALACFAIIAGPAFLVARDIWGSAWTMSQPQFIGAVAAGVVVLFLVSHALSTMIRSRSALLGLDIALVVAAGFIAISLGKPLLVGQGVLLALRLGVAVLAAITLVLAVAPVWQLAKGRADVRRNHAALSRFVWSGVGVVLLAAAAFVWWVVTPSPSDLVRGVVVQAPGGRWVYVNGAAKYRGDYVTSFLLDTKSGMRLRGPLPWTGPVFSRDGRIAAMTATDSLAPNHSDDVTLYLVNLAEAKPKLRDTRIPAGREFALSDDGRRVVTIDENGVVSVHDVAREALLVSARGLEGRASHAVMFLTPGLVRIWQYNNAKTRSVEIFELDVARRSLAKTGQSATTASYRGLTANADGSRVLLNEAGVLIDGRTGATIRQFPAGRRMGGVILSDGTIALIERGAGRMHVFDANGNPLRQVSIPGAKWVRIGAELAGGRVALTTVDHPRVETAYIIDVRSGAVVQRLQGSHVATPWYSIDPRIPLLAADTDIALASVGGGIALWDLKTGQRKPL